VNGARGRCPWCGRTRGLRNDGKLRVHNKRDSVDRCPGSGGWPTTRTVGRGLGDVGPGMVRRPPP
jgi:hypothetical protein